MLDSCSTDRVSIVVYENQFLRVVLRAITADSTKCKSFLQAYCELEAYALVHLSIQEAVVFVHCRVL